MGTRCALFAALLAVFSAAPGCLLVLDGAPFAPAPAAPRDGALVRDATEFLRDASVIAADALDARTNRDATARTESGDAPSAPDVPLLDGSVFADAVPVRDAAPPPDGPTCSGAAGTPCCAGDACARGLMCVDWSSGSVSDRRCGLCGGLGQPCCANSPRCSSGGTTVTLCNGTSPSCFCASDTTSSPIAGRACAPSGGMCSATTACVAERPLGSSCSGLLLRGRCIECGALGLPCCYGGTCADGSSCDSRPTASSIYLCR